MSKLTFNQLRERLAVYYDMPDAKSVAVSSLTWRVLVDGHAAIAWFNLDGDLYDFPFAALAVDDKVYVSVSPIAVSCLGYVGDSAWFDIESDERVSAPEIARIVYKLSKS